MNNLERIKVFLQYKKEVIAEQEYIIDKLIKEANIDIEKFFFDCDVCGDIILEENNLTIIIPSNLYPLIRLEYENTIFEHRSINDIIWHITTLPENIKKKIIKQ